MKHLDDHERARLLEAIGGEARLRGLEPSSSPWFDGLLVKMARRAPRHVKELELRRRLEDAGLAPPPWPPREDSWFLELSGFVADELVKLVEREDFQAVEAVVLRRDQAAFSDMVAALDRRLKLKGMIYNRGLDPADEYPKVVSKIWEAVPKWDGRDFTAYIARTVKNFCNDLHKARKKAQQALPEGVPDRRHGARTSEKVELRDTLQSIFELIAELERGGNIGALDAALFGRLLAGDGVSDLVAALTGDPGLEAFRRAAETLASGKRLSAGEALALKGLSEGHEPSSLAALSGCSVALLGQAADAWSGAEATPLSRALCRRGLSLSALRRSKNISANAINLRVNRLRLKVWHGLCDRAFRSLSDRRAGLDGLDRALIAERCDAEGKPSCHFYKDRRCKREADLTEMTRRADLTSPTEVFDQRLSALRERMLDELGGVMPDYNSCLFERS